METPVKRLHEFEQQSLCVRIMGVYKLTVDMSFLEVLSDDSLTT